jgi:hypothetical protein
MAQSGSFSSPFVPPATLGTEPKRHFRGDGVAPGCHGAKLKLTMTYVDWFGLI